MYHINKTSNSIKFRVLEKNANGTLIYGWRTVHPGRIIDITSINVELEETNNKSALNHGLVIATDDEVKKIQDADKKNQKQTKKTTKK